MVLLSALDSRISSLEPVSRNQRLSYLGVAAAIAVVALVMLAAGSGPDETAEDADTQAARQTATPSATAEGGSTSSATPEPTPTATPRPRPPLLRAGEATRLRFTEGETVRFRARSEGHEEIHVHGYDRYVDLPAGETVDVDFEAGITGIFEVELHGSGETIAQLRVDPE
jgi:hypothetical protein